MEIFLTLIILLLALYAWQMTAWVLRAKRSCTCGACSGKFSIVTDVPIKKLSQITHNEDHRLARRWTDEDFAKLLPTGEDGRQL